MEFEWVCPATKAPADLQRSLNLINNFLLDPLDLNGKKALQMISKQSKRKPQAKTKAKRSAPTGRGFLDDNLLDDEDEERDGELRIRGSKRAEKKKREKVKAISAQFIEDSDAEIGDDEEFFRKEKELRERMEKAAASGVIAQGAGTKKRRKNDEEDDDGGKARKRRKSEVKKKKAKQSSEEEDDNGSSEDEQRPTISQLESTPALSDDEEPLVLEPKPNGSTAGSPPPPSSRAPSSRFDDSDEEELVSRPGLTNGKRVSTASSVALFLSESEMEEDEDLPTLTQGQRAVRQRQRLVISDEEDE
jgi:replication fork protection complex subunit Tof1/Swi1